MSTSTPAEKMTKLSILLNEVQQSLTQCSAYLTKGESRTFGIRVLISKGLLGYNVTAVDQVGRFYCGPDVQSVSLKMYPHM